MKEYGPSYLAVIHEWRRHDRADSIPVVIPPDSGPVESRSVPHSKSPRRNGRVMLAGRDRGPMRLW